MKCYKLYIVNTVMKNISGLTYLSIDRSKILAPAGTGMRSEENTRAIPFSRVRRMEQSAIRNVTGINEVSSQKLDGEMNMQSYPGTACLGYKYVACATTEGTKQGRTQISIQMSVKVPERDISGTGQGKKQERERTVALMGMKQGDILYLSLQRTLENVNQLGYMNYLGEKEVVWPRLNQGMTRRRTGRNVGGLMLGTEVPEVSGSKSETQKGIVPETREGVRKMMKRTRSDQSAGSEREMERSAPGIRIQKSQVGGANLTIQIDTQISETLRSLDYHKELVIAKYRRTGF